MGNYYHILGISKDASRKEIRSAFIREARIWHPDVTEKDLETARKHFQKLNEAYQGLTEEPSSSAEETRIRHADYLETMREIRNWKPSAAYRARRKKRPGIIQFGRFGGKRRR